MNLKLSTWLVVALAGGAIFAGCGSSSKSTAGSQATSTGSTAIGPAALTPAQAQQAVVSCKRSIRAQSTISPSAKAQLEKTCEKAATGSSASLQKVAEEVCVGLVNASHIPGGAARERALAICKVK
jgi:hypothetical protein